MSISCPSSNGMSGGPIIMETDNGYKVVGVLNGGPCGTAHNKLMVTIFETAPGININSLFKLLKKVEKHIKAIESSGAHISYNLHMFWVQVEECVEIINNRVNLSYFNNLQIIQQLRDLYSKVLIIEEESGRNVDYNIGLTHEMFMNDLNSIIK